MNSSAKRFQAALVLLVACWLGRGTLLALPSVTRGPYLQLETSTNIIVRWRTSALTDGRVHYGTNLADLNFTADDSASVTNGHTVLLPDLLPGTKYFYSIGTSSAVLEGGDTNHFFTTAPVPGTPKPTRIWVIGDAGTKDNNQKAVRDAYYSFTSGRETDLWLMLGDNAYNTGTDAEYQSAVFDVYGDLLRKSVLWPTLGNHDTAFATDFVDTYPYFSIFDSPKNGEAGGVASGSEHYYSFDYGNIHFICLDSMTADRSTNGAMAMWLRADLDSTTNTWLRADLDSTTNTWLIAYWHHPPYSKGSHDSDTETELVEMRENFLPILEEGGVDLVLSGHSHAYERSFLLDGHYGDSTTLQETMKLNPNGGREEESGPYVKSPGFISHQGTVYAVAGSSGETAGGTLDHPAMFISLNELGSLVLDVNGDRLDATFLRDTGVAEDHFSIVKREVCLNAPEILPDGNMQLTLTNVAAGKTNVLQASATLTNWISLSTNLIFSNSISFTDFDATNHPVRFYRVLRLP